MAFKRKKRNFKKTEEEQLPIRKKVCRFCTHQDQKIDYKDAKALKYFLTERDKILSRRITGLCAYHQRLLTNAIKKARILAILPFSSGYQETL